MVALETDLNPPSDVARFLSAELGLRPPVHVVAVARACGVPVLPLPPGGPSDVDACLAYHPPDTWAIFVAPGRGNGRRRFSIAHELGHYLLHRDLIAAGIPLGPEHEREANEFAAELLMPEEVIGRTARNQLEELKHRFLVSGGALQVRLERLGVLPRASAGTRPNMVGGDRQLIQGPKARAHT